MILTFTVNIVCADGLAFLLVGTWPQVFDFYWNSGTPFLCPSNAIRCFWQKMGGRRGSDGGGGKKNLNFGRGYPKKKVGKKWDGGREGKKWAGVGGLNTTPPVLPHGANYPNLKQWLEQIAMLWHSLNQCWLIISEVKWLLSVWSFIRMWWIKFWKKVKLDLIFLSDTFLDVNQSNFSEVRFDFPITDIFLGVNQSKFKLCLIHIQKGISDNKIKSNLTFCKISSPFGAD